MRRLHFYLLVSLLSVLSLQGEELSQDPVLMQSLQRIVLCGASDEIADLSRDAIVLDESVKNLGEEEPLRERLSEFLEKPLTRQGLKEMKQTIADHYQPGRSSYVVVDFPEQDISQGTLRCKVADQRLGCVKVEGAHWTSAKRLEQYVHVRPGQPLNQDQLIQDVSFINRHPFRRVDLVFTPGDTWGTTDVILATRDRRSLRFYSGMNNTGVKFTEATRWYAGANWGNVFGLDHILSYQFTSSWDTNRFLAHTVEYLAPLSWGHVFNVYGGYSQVSPPLSYGQTKNSGWSMQASARYVIPLTIYQYLEHELTLGSDFKRSNNTFGLTEDYPVFGNNVNLTQAVLGYSGNFERNWVRIDFETNLYWSPGKWISDQSTEAYESLRPGATNHWVYWRGSFRCLYKMPYDFSWTLLLAGQASSEPLLPSEQFGLGGYDTVRGYDQRQLNYDDAFLGSFEFRSPGLPLTKWISPSTKLSDGLQFIAFVDYGCGTNIETYPGIPNNDYLLGAGPGLRYTLEPYVTARLDWGIRLHNQKDFSGGSSMIHFSLTAGY